MLLINIDTFKCAQVLLPRLIHCSYHESKSTPSSNQELEIWGHSLKNTNYKIDLKNSLKKLVKAHTTYLFVNPLHDKIGTF